MSKLFLFLFSATVPLVGSLQLAAPATKIALRPVAPLARAALIRMADDDPDPDAVIKAAVEKLKKTVASTQESLSTLRVGRASPSLLDRVEVDYYGALTPLNQLAMVTAPTASQLVIEVFDPTVLGDVEKALYDSDLGMTPNNDGKCIRLNVPALTEDRRKELAKTAKSVGEDGKVAVRNIRKGALDKLKKMKKAIGEDVAKDKEEGLQKAIKKYEDEIAEQVASREKEIMTV